MHGSISGRGEREGRGGAWPDGAAVGGVPQEAGVTLPSPAPTSLVLIYGAPGGLVETRQVRHLVVT